jgi:hypothetical protein
MAERRAPEDAATTNAPVLAVGGPVAAVLLSACDCLGEGCA